jgi:hypothetical protein
MAPPTPGKYFRQHLSPGGERCIGSRRLSRFYALDKIDDLEAALQDHLDMWEDDIANKRSRQHDRDSAVGEEHSDRYSGSYYDADRGDDETAAMFTDRYEVASNELDDLGEWERTKNLLRKVGQAVTADRSWAESALQRKRYSWLARVAFWHGLVEEMTNDGITDRRLRAAQEALDRAEQHVKSVERAEQVFAGEQTKQESRQVSAGGFVERVLNGVRGWFR